MTLLLMSLTLTPTCPLARPGILTLASRLMPLASANSTSKSVVSSFMAASLGGGETTEHIQIRRIAGKKAVLLLPILLTSGDLQDTLVSLATQGKSARR